MTTLRLALSPCPNDTFMFDALLHDRVPCPGIRFERLFADIEELNRGVLAGRVQVSKISAALLPLVVHRYAVLDSGAALGRGNGPLLVARRGARIDPRQGGSLRCAVPGLHTTAHALLGRLFPTITRREPLLFSRIAPAVASGAYDVGVLIHEGRFTYADHGLELVTDLGRAWEAAGQCALPLGLIVVRRDVPLTVARTVEEALAASVAYAFDHPEASRPFVEAHAQEMDSEVMRQHIALFVNAYSRSLGAEGRHAVQALTGLGAEAFLVGA